MKISELEFKEVQTSCSCCGAEPKKTKGTDFYGKPYEFEVKVVRAGLCDRDGVYYSYLCHISPGNGCLDWILKEQEKVSSLTQEKLETLKEVLGEDEDGIWSEMNQ